MTHEAPPADDSFAKWLKEHGDVLIGCEIRGALARARQRHGDWTVLPDEFPSWIHAHHAGYRADGIDLDALARIDLESLMTLAAEAVRCAILVGDFARPDEFENGSPAVTLASHARLWRRSALRHVVDASERAPRPTPHLVTDDEAEAPQ